MKFKKKSKKPLIEKTITVLDAETNEIEEVFDIVEGDEVTEIELEDEAPTLDDQEMKDLAFVTALRKDYNDVKDFESFVKDACADKKKTLSDEETLTDEEKAKKEAEEKAAQEKIKALADGESNTPEEVEKMLKQKEKSLEDEQKLQEEIIEAERKKHEAARNQ